jgi:hypothetical protein
LGFLGGKLGFLVRVNRNETFYKLKIRKPNPKTSKFPVYMLGIRAAPQAIALERINSTML